MSNRNKGIICIILSAFFFALMSCFARMAGDLPSVQKAFFRNIVAMFFTLIVLLKSQGKITIHKKNLPKLILRSTFGTIGILCNFYAVDHMIVSDANMLSKLSPFFTIAFSAILLKEKVKSYQFVGLIGAFAGSLLIIKPTGATFTDIVPALAGLVSGMSAGIAYAFVRALQKEGANGQVIIFFFSAFSCAITLPFFIIGFVPMSSTQIMYLILTGLAGAGGQFSVTAAYSFAPANQISVFDYTQVVFSAIFGFFFFGQFPDRVSVIGYFIVCGVAVLMFLRGKRDEQLA